MGFVFLCLCLVSLLSSCFMSSELGFMASENVFSLPIPSSALVNTHLSSVPPGQAVRGFPVPILFLPEMVCYLCHLEDAYASGGQANRLWV